MSYPVSGNPFQHLQYGSLQKTYGQQGGRRPGGPHHGHQPQAGQQGGFQWGQPPQNNGYDRSVPFGNQQGFDCCG